ncbi:sugar transferase [Clostridium isatidis]|uniref:sugar transferase n=1 Tax=Clostridium isatidis TaxID=182773 RepID=UPI003AACFF26
MDLAPIVIFTFNRIDHTKKTVEALKSNYLSQESELFIFSDGPRDEEEKLKVDEVRRFIKNIDGFKKITIFESNINKGLAKSVIEGVTDIINKYNKVIVLEDDLVTSKYFLKYMNEALDLFEKKNDIWSISGYGPNIKMPEDYIDDVYITRRGSSWGWATWKDRWTMVDWKVSDYNLFKKDREAVKRFNSSGKDLSPMLEDQMRGRIDSWAIRWVYSQFKNNKYTVYPIKSLVRNIGNDLSGTHTINTNHFDVVFSNEEVYINKDLVENTEIRMNFKAFYDNNFSGYLALFIKKIGLYKVFRKIRNYIIKKIRI